VMPFGRWKQVGVTVAGVGCIRNRRRSGREPAAGNAGVRDSIREGAEAEVILDEAEIVAAADRTDAEICAAKRWVE